MVFYVLLTVKALIPGEGVVSHSFGIPFVLRPLYLAEHEDLVLTAVRTWNVVAASVGFFVLAINIGFACGGRRDFDGFFIPKSY